MPTEGRPLGEAGGSPTEGRPLGQAGGASAEGRPPGEADGSIDDGGRVGAVFSALADDTRRRVVSQLSAGGSATPTQLASQLPMTRQAVAKHLATLESAGLVAATRAGREAHYRLTPAPLADALAWMAEVGARWDERLDALRTLLSDDAER